MRFLIFIMGRNIILRFVIVIYTYIKGYALTFGINPVDELSRKTYRLWEEQKDKEHNYENAAL